MTEQIYRKLAQRLDTLPIGFPATASGVELRLLARIFTPEQAALAAAMDRSLQPAGEIAERAGVVPEAAGPLLKEMVRLGLIRAKKQEGGLTFGLIPLIAGIFEAQLPRMDAEMAALFEAYYRETKGGHWIVDPPGIHRVIPVEQSIGGSMEIFPYEQASRLLDTARSWGVRDCACRVQKRLIGEGCDYPVDVCLLFAPVEGAFDHSEVDRAIGKEEALAVLQRAAEAGLVHSTYNFREGVYHICSCCPCCCMMLRGATEFGRLSAVAHSAFHSAVNADLCSGCGDCLSRCHFGALSLPAEVVVVDALRCMGCGLCTMVCPTGALHLERLPQAEVMADRDEWSSRRFEARPDPKG